MKAENVVLPLTILQNYVLVFFQKINRGGDIQDRKVSSISLAPIHVSHTLKAMCHTDALLWSARKIALMALPAARERHAKNVWHIALRACETLWSAREMASVAL